MKRTRGVECLVKPFDCISRGCVEIMEQDSNGRIPLILLRELLPCSSHSRFLNQSPNLVRHLGMISMQNNWETLTLEDGFILGFSFKQDIFMLFWSKSFVIRSDIFEAIVSRRSLHEWIRSASFEVLLRERFLLNQLLRKNEEYFELHDAFESILKAHDQYGMFNLKDSRTISFFKKCLDLSSSGTVSLSVEDTPILDPFSWPLEEIASGDEKVECAKVKPYVARVQFSSRTLYAKLEPISIESAILTCFSFLNHLFPQVRIGSLVLDPRIYIYGVCGTSDISLKSAVEGVQLIDWNSDTGVSCLDTFVVSIAASSIGVYLFGINDRHGRNIIINPQTSQYVNIDNKHCMGKKPIGLDSYGIGMVPSLWSFLDANNRIEVLRNICSHLFTCVQMHEYEIIKVAKIAFHSFIEPAHIAYFITSRIRDKKGMLSSLESSLYNVGKNVKQGGVMVAIKELMSTLK
jgi:hypothetical protein